MADRYVIAGGSGLIGRALAGALAGGGGDVIVLSRSGAPSRPQADPCPNPSNTDGVAHGSARPVARGSPRPVARVQWDGQSLGAWARDLETAAAVVNLTGRNIGTRWTPDARREIRDSRVNSARVIGEAIAQCSNPPRVWVNASAVGVYGDRGDEVLDESSPLAPEGTDFLGDVGRAWESAVNDAQVPSRKVITRFGVVFAPDDPALRILVRVTKLFAGGRLGNGRQWMPWIHVDDVVRAIRWAIDAEGAAGAYNVTSPNPVRNADLMRELRRILHRPPAPPAPAWAAKLAGKIIGLPIEPALASSRVIPRRLIEAGFVFRHPDLAEALESLLKR